MSLVCEICAKSYKKGNKVKRLIGNRVSGRSIRKQLPNLRSRRFEIDGTVVSVKLCASCLKRFKKDSKVSVNPNFKFA